MYGLAVAAALGPVVVHDSRETSPLASVGSRPGTFAAEPVAYERTAGEWRQWWLAYARNDQDRGILRTGRHAGDWELIQVRLDRGRPVEAVYAQHSGAERCPWSAVETRGGRPVVYVAGGSHAAYFRPGVRDRTWPDPNDETDGRGLRVRPRVVRVDASAPAWMRYRGRWGESRAGWVPGEMDSPRGPAFQPQGRWSHVAGWAAGARECTRRDCDARGECDGRETAVAGVLAGFGVVWALWLGVRRMRRVDGGGSGGR
jgi:Vacuolar protein sorting-associated protein 62